MEHRPLIIVGAGPAGTAAALYLQRRDPSLACEILLLDKAHHPRDKVCAGGLIPQTIDCLDELDVPLAVPHVRVDNAQVLVPGSTVAYRGQNLCQVVRRHEFDALLAGTCIERGIEVRGGERVLDLRRENGRIRVETEHSSFTADAVIGADGSGSRVRRKLLGGAALNTGRGVMCDVPLAETTWRGHGERRYDFNFLPVADGLKGYAWAFPCLIAGEPHVNIGVYSVTMEGAVLGDLVRRETARLGAVPARIQAFPIHWYDRGATVGGPGVALVGDAAGVDPLMGEGISYAFEYGKLAAEVLIAQRARGSNDLSHYGDVVRRSWMGRKLSRLRLATRLFYGPTKRLWFAVAARSRRAQELGIRWYNGVDGVDRMSLLEGVRAFRTLHARNSS